LRDIQRICCSKQQEHSAEPHAHRRRSNRFARRMHVARQHFHHTVAVRLPLRFIVMADLRNDCRAEADYIAQAFMMQNLKGSDCTVLRARLYVATLFAAPAHTHVHAADTPFSLAAAS